MDSGPSRLGSSSDPFAADRGLWLLARAARSPGAADDVVDVGVGHYWIDGQRHDTIVMALAFGKSARREAEPLFVVGVQV